MDPMTQSAQISSSQGFADGQNSAAKESKLSDSFLSSSPVSLIQSPQDKRVVLGSEKPCEGVATSLRFPSQPGSFSPGNYGSQAGPSDDQPDSPIKTSPVSERIKALEALAAKKKEPDFRSDGGFSHYRDRHHEKSPFETPKAPPEKTVEKRGGSTDLDSPESPFEVLGDLRQVNEFEETEEWMKTHLPPVPDFDPVHLIKGSSVSASVPSKEAKEADIIIPDAPEAFAGVPDAFMDSPAAAQKLKDDLIDPQNQPSAEEDFDLSFLPTAYVWDQQDKSGQHPTNPDQIVPASPAPPAGFGSPSPPASPLVDKESKQNLDDQKSILTGDLEPPEASEVDSSGESDDTVIEDGVTVSASVPSPPSDAVVSNDHTTTSASSASNPPTEVKEASSAKSERKLMQVPTINVIETDEPNYSDEEMEMELEPEEDDDYEVVKDPSKKTADTAEPVPDDGKAEPPKTRPLETEFMEGYSPPSSPVDSDVEYSPKHKMPRSQPEADLESTSKLESQSSPTVSHDSTNEFFRTQTEELPNTVTKMKEPSSIPVNEDVDFPDNDDEWSDEAQDILVKPSNPIPNPYNLSNMDEKITTPGKEACTEAVKTSFMQDDIYDRQSFDYDYDGVSSLDDIDERESYNPKDQLPPDPYQIHNEASSRQQNLDKFTSQNDDGVDQPVSKVYPQDPYSSFRSEPLSNIKETKEKKTDIDKNSNSILTQEIKSQVQKNTQLSDLMCDTTTNQETIESLSGPTDSFVEFMRECLKSRQDEDAENMEHDISQKSDFSKTTVQSPPTMVMDLEQEQLTISALKELGSSQEEEEEEADKAGPDAGSIQQSSSTSVPNPPCTQSNVTFDNTYSREVEVIDELVAEAYHLAEHVLTAILTHLSVKDLIHWRDPKKSGVVFGLTMLLLLSLAAFSVISVVSYLLLALLCVTITFRIYKSVVQAVQKSSEGHPFKALIDKDVSIPPETFRKHVDASLTYINRALKQMSRLFLVEDLVDSLKLAVVMWLLTYVGAVFNGITILILADILLFAVPPIYEKNKTQIDQYIDLVRTQVNTTIAKLQEKLPGAVKRSKAE
ncbi:reticulon-3 isoform X2 [Sphaeramia orbicularis]|uniref:reticulon-3 isoform X2 n=1 Tax=Sphaeramia orbicularis TaxID=375764 RepID=UPI00117EBEEA|nr:reticulon-1-like isoform X2 [Sphaeramia orbicularis]